MVTEKLSLEGHLLDEHRLGNVLDVLNRHGVEFKVKRFLVGENSEEASVVELHLKADSLTRMREALQECQVFGASFSVENAVLVEADMDGVLPEDFYSTTNFTTNLLVEGEWVAVENIEMDCGIRVWRHGEHWRAETCPMHRVRKGDSLVVGYDGVRVEPSADDVADEEEFRFMSNDVSTERPKARLIAHAAESVRRAKGEGKRILLVGGPAIVHCGCASVLEKLILDGWIDVLFAGNALAAHDIEAAMLGTSLGVDLGTGSSGPHGHTHHLRAINRVRRAGSIAQAVEQRLIGGGIMHACVIKPIPFVLCGSIRDDGPLPEVYTNVVEGTDAMRANIADIGVALMVATTLHSVATGNILPASVKTFCIDSDADSVIKLTDRGTHQAVGIVTDCEFFLRELARQLDQMANA